MSNAIHIIIDIPEEEEFQRISVEDKQKN